jgi:hypothetical protein
MKYERVSKEVKLYYQLKTQLGDKFRYVCVVVKMTVKNEEFIVSAMTTGGIKEGELIYRKDLKI